MKTFKHGRQLVRTVTTKALMIRLVWFGFLCWDKWREFSEIRHKSSLEIVYCWCREVIPIIRQGGKVGQQCDYRLHSPLFFTVATSQALSLRANQHTYSTHSHTLSLRWRGYLSSSSLLKRTKDHYKSLGYSPNTKTTKQDYVQGLEFTWDYTVLASNTLLLS